MLNNVIYPVRKDRNVEKYLKASIIRLIFLAPSVDLPCSLTGVLTCSLSLVMEARVSTDFVLCGLE